MANRKDYYMALSSNRSGHDAFNVVIRVRVSVALPYGQVAEWSKAPDCKSGVLRGYVSSNLTLFTSVVRRNKSRIYNLSKYQMCRRAANVKRYACSLSLMVKL